MDALKSRDPLLVDDPFALFGLWQDEATQSEPNDPTAMAVSSVDAQGLPDIRMVLLKAWDARGFVFYTNFESAKGRELEGHPKAAALFHWKSRRRQIRIRGPVEVVTVAEADAYFASRPRGSRVGAWASAQSRPLASRDVLEGHSRAGRGTLPGRRTAAAALERLPNRAARNRVLVRRRPSPARPLPVCARRGSAKAWTKTRLYP